MYISLTDIVISTINIPQKDKTCLNALIVGDREWRIVAARSQGWAEDCRTSVYYMDREDSDNI